MLMNEVIDTIMTKRRSYKQFDGRPLDDEIIETILECGKIAPTGMNRQSWHFTVIKSAEAMEELGKDLLELQAKMMAAGAGGPGGPGPGGPGPGAGAPGGPGGPGPGGPGLGPGGPGPGGPGPGPGGPGPGLSPDMTARERTRNAPLMIIVSGEIDNICAHIDAPLAMENMLLAAASLGLGTGWEFAVNKDLLEGEDGASYKAKYQIPAGYKAYCACYFGYRDESQPDRDRGPRREGTVTVL